MNLRDNKDGSCNCRPLGEGCFFTDRFGGKCDCPNGCHQPKPEVKCEGEDTHEKGACPALADALSSPASTEEWANNWEKNLAQIIVNCKEKKISPEEAVVQTRSLLASHDQQLRQGIVESLKVLLITDSRFNDKLTGVEIAEIAHFITNL